MIIAIYSTEYVIYYTVTSSYVDEIVPVIRLMITAEDNCDQSTRYSDILIPDKEIRRIKSLAKWI